MFLNKEKRLQYLGFDDRWFMIVGIIILSFVTDYLFNDSFGRHKLLEAIITWSISLFFTICNWFFMRSVLIYLRKRFPSLSESLKRILILFVFLVVSVPLIDFLGSNLLKLLIPELNYNFTSRFKVLLPIILISTMVQAIYEAIFNYVRLKESIREEEQAKQIIVQAQLDALRNQAQPHFFFNTLNTLRDIIDQNTREEAKEFVDKLSDVYRFILDSGNVNLTSLKDELKFAKAYIHIQSERFGENLKVHWDISEAADEKMVVPMSLQLLLENAIKHNVVSKAKPLIVTVTDEGGNLLVLNKIQPKSTKLPSTKVGLKNIEKRYTLISNQSIKIENDGENFKVSLPLLDHSDQKNSHANINN